MPALPPTETKKNKLDYLFDIDFKKYYVLLSEQKSFILIFCCSAMLTSLAFTYFFSEKYIAGTNIYYRPIGTSLIRSKEIQAFGSPAPAPPFKVIVQTLRDIAKSDTILLPIVDKLHLDQPLNRTDASWYLHLYDTVKDTIKEYGLKLWSILKYGRIIELEPTPKAVKKLRKNINIIATKESYVYIVKAKDNFPDRAAAIVDEVSADLVAWLKSQDINTATNRLHPLEKQFLEKESDLDALRRERENFLMANNLVEVSEELSRTVENLYTLENENIQLTSEIERKSRNLVMYRKLLRQELTKKIHPTDLKKLESNMIFEEIELGGLKAKNESLNKSISDLQKRMQQMLAAKKTIEAINLQIEADTREYINIKDMYLENLSQISVGDSEIEVMHPASIPASPDQPIKIYHVALTGLLSLFFSAGLLYVFAFFNIRLFYASTGIKGRKN